MLTAVCQDEALLCASELLEALGTPICREISSAIKAGDHLRVINQVLPDTNSPTFQEDYLAVEILSKYPYLDLKVDREAVAIEKFFDVERDLAHSDNWLHRFSKGWETHRLLWSVLHTARRKIENLLGSFHFECAETYFSFGPGATVSLPRRRSSTPNKFSNPKLTVTQTCLDLAVRAVCRNRCWTDYLASRFGRDPSTWFTLVGGNKIVTVPKNAKTERTIAIEPDMNMFIQKGIGGLIRRRLKTVGVDLDNQALNQALARDASLTGDLSTIDLSSASDSVSLMLCEDMLPPDWMDAIKASRSTRGVLPDGSLINYRKVSSMGNGFTFELESLIFWALGQACIELCGAKDRRFGVYGDDLIISTDVTETFLDVLRRCGFTPNPKKTHLVGFFRESCGKHFLRGDDVTPFYFKDKVDTCSRRYWLLNSLSVFALRLGGYHYRDSRVQPIWKQVLHRVPVKLRSFGPLFLGKEESAQQSDICIGVSFDEAVPCISRSRDGLEGFLFKSRVRVEERKVANSIGSLIAFVDRFGRFYLNPRSETSRLPGKSKWVSSWTLTPQWQELGPWLTTTGIT